MARLSDRVVTGAPNGILANDEPIQWYAADGITLIDGIKVDATDAVYLAPAGGLTKVGTGGFNLPNNTPLRGTTAAGGTARMVQMSATDVIEVGATAQALELNATTTTVNSDLVVTGNIEASERVRLGNNKLLQARNQQNTQWRPVLTVDTNNDLVIGSSSTPITLDVDTTVTGGLRVSGDQATPLTNEGLYGGHPSRGAYIQGHGSANDFTVANQAGTVALVVPQNTINVEARGSLSVGDDLIFDAAASQDIYQTNSGLNLQISGGTSASLGANMVLYGNGHGSAGDWLFRNNTTTRMKLTDAGALSTTTGVLGTISERRFKTEIVEAKSQVDDIQALASRMKNFVKNDDGLKQLGWIVDEVEDDFPNLIYTETCVDADGEPDGTTRKGITIGAIQLKAVKALGEALDRIDVLEAANGELMSRLEAIEAAMAEAGVK